jgi:predicted aconitase
VFSAPQLSLYELKTLSELLAGKQVSEGTSLIVTTNRAYKSAGEALGYLRDIERAGGMVLEGVCFYILDGVARMRTENGWDNLVTNSAKLANIIKAHKYNPVLRPTEECVRIALTGRIEDS